MSAGNVGPRRIEETPENYGDMIRKLQDREKASEERVLAKKQEEVTTLIQTGQANTNKEALTILAKESFHKRRTPPSGEITPESAPLPLASRTVIEESKTPEIKSLRETLSNEQQRTTALFAEKMLKPPRAAS